MPEAEQRKALFVYEFEKLVRPLAVFIELPRPIKARTRLPPFLGE